MLRVKLVNYFSEINLLDSFPLQKNQFIECLNQSIEFLTNLKTNFLI